MNIIYTNLKFKGLSYCNIPNKIILHNADASICTIEDIHQWHLNNGWSGCGYHYFIRKDGSIYKGRPDNAIGSHCLGSNNGSIGICFEGKYMSETMPQVQYYSGIELIKTLNKKYGELRIYGHKELFSTDCPGTKFPLDNFKQLKNSRYKIGWNKNNTGWWYCTNEEGWYYKDIWKQINDIWYSFDSCGYRREKTWIKDNGYWYWLKEDGSMARNEWAWIKDRCYYFGDQGGMYSNCITPDGYWVDSTGAWEK